MKMLRDVIESARSEGLPKENYWVYFKKDGTRIEAAAEEKKRRDFIGFFVEDDSRLQSINDIAMKKIRKK